MTDHLTTTVRLLESDSILLWAPSSVIRTGCEAAAKVAHLLDSEASYQLRITPGAILLIGDAAAEVTAASEATGVVPDVPAGS